MAKEYLEKLSSLLCNLNLENEVGLPMETKHFFSGAALYVNKVICVTWSPAGLAFKLPESEIEILTRSGKATALRYFPKGHVKKGYALFENPCLENPNQWKEYFLKAVQPV